MNRREAIALLTSVPGLTAIRKADLQPGDTLVVEVKGQMVPEAAARITALVEQVFPGHKAIVLTEGTKLTVMRKG